jgi:hypothetical protein
MAYWSSRFDLCVFEGSAEAVRSSSGLDDVGAVSDAVD